MYNCDTFVHEGNLKLNCEEILTPTHSYGFNKNHPLLSHGNDLYLVLMKVVEIDRKVKKSK